MPPIPCSKCGINFMKQDQNPEIPNICNNCIKPEKKPVDEVNILITCPRKIQIEIEEACINQGVSFSQYFLALHGLHVIDLKMEHDQKIKVNLPDGFGEVTIPSVEETIEFAEPIIPKKRGRPFKNS